MIPTTCQRDTPSFREWKIHIQHFWEIQIGHTTHTLIGVGYANKQLPFGYGIAIGFGHKRRSYTRSQPQFKPWQFDQRYIHVCIRRNSVSQQFVPHIPITQSHAYGGVIPIFERLPIGSKIHSHIHSPYGRMPFVRSVNHLIHFAIRHDCSSLQRNRHRLYQ